MCEFHTSYRLPDYGRLPPCVNLFCVTVYTSRAHPAISHCSHLLLKRKVATNISHWLKVHSRWFKNYISAKKCILISFWIFQHCFYYSFTLYHCAIFSILNAGFFLLIPSGCQTVWIHIRPDILSGLIWVQSVCKGYQQMPKSLLTGKELNTEQLLDTTFWLKPWLKSISFGFNFFHLAKVLVTTNSESG